MSITAQDLNYWNDADGLFEALCQVQGDQRHLLSEAVAALLDHPDPDIRREAFRLTFVNWKASDRSVELLDALAGDSSEEVRATAAYGVAAVFKSMPEHLARRSLLDRVLDQGEALQVRRAAYEALMIVHGRAARLGLDDEFDPERDVDWPWIESLAH